MNLRQVKLVYFKEMKDIIRDKRTLRLMILVPVVFYPLMSFGITGVAMSMAKKQSAREASVLMVGLAPDIREQLQASEHRLKLLSTGDFVEAVRALDPDEYAAAVAHVDLWHSDPYDGLNDSTRTKFYLALSTPSFWRELRSCRGSR